jgi:hypothetical protein
MTRDEFIDGYIRRSVHAAKATRTADGFKVEGMRHPGFVALPCACGAAVCEGWAIVSNDEQSIADHERFNVRDG